MKCVHHYVLKPGNSAVGQCKHCSHNRTFDNEYSNKGTWVNPAAAQAAKENALPIKIGLPPTNSECIPSNRIPAC